MEKELVRKAEIQAAIFAAFPDQPVPNPQALIQSSGTEENRRRWEEEIRRQLAGKNWRTLTPEFLAQWWAWFRYLSPEGYHYYLPALLTGALQNFTQDGELLHSVVYSLVPSFWCLYYEREDHDFHDQHSTFTSDQYCAVCAFLGLVFDWLPRLRHLAAQALHWGWNRINTPALVAANQYYHRLSSYTYPESKDPEIDALCQEIGEAFADTPYPGDNHLCGSSQGDEPAEHAMDLRGVKWQSAHPELLAESYAALSFLTAEGFRYFLPAFLWADLLYSEIGIESNADPEFYLTYGLGDIKEDHYTPETERQKSVDWYAYSIDRFASFSQTERAAIIHFLEFQGKDEYRGPKVNQALENYWRPSVLIGLSQL